MLITNIYIRFYKSFNYDYLRKTHEDAKPNPWDMIETELFYPFVRVPLERSVTTVVGANESGKSQLLSAISCALTGDGIERGDFCRYSQFFAVDRSMAFPEFGLEFAISTDTDRKKVAELCGLDEDDDVISVALFRFGRAEPVAYVKRRDAWSEQKLAQPTKLASILPCPFEIDASVPLPDSVPIRYLASGSFDSDVRLRPERRRLISSFLSNMTWFASQETVQGSASTIAHAFKPATETQPVDSEIQLADDLMTKVAKIDRTAFQELYQAVERGAEGYANGIVEQINKELAKSLNFPKWWSQDRHFQLLVTLRDLDLVFTIKDRTGTEYSFAERSGGLKYFLSYFVQYLAHEPPDPGRDEILLMDEPDAYLSSMGQQDLLRIFEAFAYPTTGRPPCQVVYVTHSPFLIDKNHGERLRVLEKGEGDEGTRVVRNVARNHYEPLRSAFGSFVGETTFISNCNLMLEGIADQVLLAGMSARLRSLGAPTIENVDLNTVTLVPAGSASQIPYLVYLARGRDADRPAVIVLLDSDKAGNEARRDLERGGARNRQLLDPQYILQVGAIGSKVTSPNPRGVCVLEDLVPPELALAAVRRYVAEFLAAEDTAGVASLQISDLDFSDGADSHEAVERAVKAVLGDDFHLDKLGFARSIIDAINVDGDLLSESLPVIDGNFKVLFRNLGRLQRNANREAAEERTGAKIKRLKESFLLDNRSGATREQAMVLLEEIDASLGSSLGAEELRSALRKIQITFELDSDLTNAVLDFDAFRLALDSLVYVEVRESQDSALGS